MELTTITGPPGTGKTTTISNYVRQFVEDDKVDRGKIVVGSLTRTAAREAARAVSLPQRQIGTWHAFAYHALGEPELTEKHISDFNAAHQRFALSGGAKGGVDSPDLGSTGWSDNDRLMLGYSKYRAAGVKRPFPDQRVEGFAEAWDDWKKQTGYIDFSDVIERALDIDEAPGSPSILLCDEAQDLSAAEAKLVAHWARKADKLILAGDNHQSIFGWRGSDPGGVAGIWDAMPVSFRDDTVLRQSYRLPIKVHEVAMRQMKRCAPIPEVAYDARQEIGVVRHAALAFKYGPDLLRSVLRQAGDGSVMFLATCGYMLSSVIEALKVAGIAWHNPWRRANGRWNPLEVSRGVSYRNRVCAFLRPSAEYYGEQARYWTVGDLKAWAHALPAAAFTRGGKKAIADLKGESSPRELAGKMREWFEPSALDRVADLDLGWFLETTRPATKSQLGASLVRQIVKTQGGAALLEEPRVIVGTVHSLKGAEADTVVVCPDLSQAAVEGASKDIRVKQEMYRVFYVAVTRAKQQMILCQPGSKYYMQL